MAKVRIATDAQTSVSVDTEVALLRDLDVVTLRARWETIFRRKSRAHLSRQLLFRILAYQIQAERLGDVDPDSRRILDQSGSPEQASSRAAEANRRDSKLRPGTMLDREWNGQMHRVAVMVDGFAWNGSIYPSLTKVAYAITGT